ncbi:MAG: Rpn family recombination-promoting nuclease/putative transposase [Sebaldella sp.]|nr:Rpn family recombination-promoting nuclease/putative transposase [Sebaldella sp.]
MGLVSRNAHDLLFRKIMSDIEVVKSFLENYLPKNLENIKKFDNLVIESPIIISSDLRESIGDVLCKVSLNKEIEVYFLIEHKSYIDKNISLQLLEYMAKIWRNQNKKSIKNQFIYPILIYHGYKNWNIGLNLRENFYTFSSETGKYFPDFEYILCDLMALEYSDIKGNETLKALLKLLKYSSEIMNNEKVNLIINSLNKVKGDNYKAMLKYFLETYDIDSEMLKIVTNKLDKKKGEKIMTMIQRWIKDGVRSGIRDGKREGIKIGEINGMKKAINVLLELNYEEHLDEFQEKILKIKDIRKLEELLELMRYKRSSTEIRERLEN